MLSTLQERHARLLRWLLISGWLALIASLLIPNVPFSGNRVFWGTVVPVVLLLIGAISHELWRRLCPLAFVSQLAQALGRQRTRPGKGNRPELVMVKADSWLGRHHVELQWSLLIAGLCLRLLGGNSHPLLLALWLTVTLLAALVVGWAYGGKAWCQYVCPMGPVQTVLTGVRGPLGTPAHVAAPSRLTQSMCRTITPEGKERSACVACQTPCLDIDAERGFWQTLKGKRGLAWAWASYPGLVLAFFLLLEWSGHGSAFSSHPLGYLRSGAWALDRGLVDRAWQPLPPLGPLPRLWMIPLALSAAAWLSVALWRGVEHLLLQQGLAQGWPAAKERAALRSRLLASYVAINLLFWFVDPLQGVLGPQGGQVVRSLVLVLTSLALFRGWRRDQATYRRESTSDSLRRQLHELPGLEPALDGRSLDALSPEEVFTLVKALPALGLHLARRVYGEVMADMLRGGRLDQAQTLLELQELRQSLGLADDDHHAVVSLLGKEHPELLGKTRLELQRDDLRQEVAQASISDFLRQQGLTVLHPQQLNPGQLEQLDRLRLGSGLSQATWDQMVERFGPRGELERQRLAPLQAQWLEEAGLLAWLDTKVPGDPPLRPLRCVLASRVEDLRRQLAPRLEAAGLEPLPTTVAPTGDLRQVFDLLWRDPDPDTAAWVLMLERQRHPDDLPRRLRDLRPDLAPSPFLTSQLEGPPPTQQAVLEALTGWAMFADVHPSGLLWLAERGAVKPWAPGDLVMAQGAGSDHLALVLAGDVQVRIDQEEVATLGPGNAIGEIGVITSQPRTASVRAGANGCHLFLLPASAFEDLLRRSSTFSRSLLVQLAQRLASTSRQLAKARLDD
ncbi:MAG: cyclic nucleotide-binding domain-containing protein [Cyanobacteriota bacterium]